MQKYFSQKVFVELYALTYRSLSTRIHTKIANQGKSQMHAEKKERKTEQKDFPEIHIPIKQVTDLAGLAFVPSLQPSLGKSIPCGSC